jgi:hypothetical protein
MASQPTPTVSAADVERIVRRDFPAESVNEVFSVLGEYGKESWLREVDRVRRAALKLAKGNIERLRREIESANCDYRDVLAAAEYPEYSKRMCGSLSDEEGQRIIDADWKQYEAWLRRG